MEQQKKRQNPIWKWTKRLLKFVGILLLLLIIAAIAIPYFFKDQILEYVKSEMNDRLTAKVDFPVEKVQLSLLSTFPQLTFQMDSLTVTGTGEFEGLKLVDMQKMKIGINIWSIFSSKYQVNSFTMDNANFYVKVLNNGKANYDIMKKDSTATPEKPAETTSDDSKIDLKIDYYALNNVNVVYDDAASKNYVEVKGLTHSGRGDMYSDIFELFTDTKIEELTVSANRVKYLKKAKLDVVFNTQVDSKNKKYTLLDNSVKINALELKFEGEVTQPNDKDLGLDLKFNAPSTSFASVLSLIPAAYTKDFADVKTSGTFALNGNVKGTYNEKQMPAFALNLGIDNGTFQYPSLPLGVKDIHTKIAVNSPSSDLDKMTVDVSKFHFLLGSNPFDLTLKLRTPMSDPDIDTKIKGKILFDELAKAFPMEGVTKLTGSMDADLEAKTKVSYVTNKQYDLVTMRGLFAIMGMQYESAGAAPMTINEMRMDFTPNNVNLQNFDLKIGKSDIRATGTLDNILTYFAGDKIMHGNLVVNSNLLDVNEIQGKKTEEKTDPKAATNMVDTTSAPKDGKVFDKFDFAMEANLNQIVYDVYQILGFKAKGSFAPSRAELTNMQMKIGSVDVQANGYMENVFGYLFDNSLLRGSLNFNSNYMNLNQFMTANGSATEPTPTPAPADPSTAKSETQPILIPANLDFALNSTFGQLIYETYKLKNVKAKLRVHNQILDIDDLSADALGGRLAFNGEYNTQNPEKPSFKFGYDVNSLDIQEIAKTVGVSQYFLPILKNIYGKLTSNFKINGILNKNMYPDLKSLTANGMLKTFDAVLKNFAPTRKLAQEIKLKEVEEIDLKNTTNFFTVKDGKVTFERFAHNFKGIDVTMEGSHGLDNSLDYKTTFRIPRKLLESNPIGQAAGQAVNTGIQFFNSQAKQLGVQLEQSEFINIGVDIKGSMSDPKYIVKLLGAEGKGGQSLGGQILNNAKDELNKLKEEAEAKARAEAERLKAEAEERVRAETERLRAEAEARAKALADKIKSETDAKARAEAERLKAEAEAKAKALADKIKADERAKAVQDSIKKAMQNKNPFGNGLPFGNKKNN